MKVLLASFIPIVVLVCNYFIYIKTNERILNLQNYPPFPSFDYTFSNELNSEVDIYNLLDNNPETYWTKLRISNREEDFLLSLGLTHTIENGKIKSKNYERLNIVGCENTSGILKINLRLEEAINIDKEMRFPFNQVFLESNLNFSESNKFIIKLPVNLRPTSSNEFSENMFQYNLTGKWERKENEFESQCLSDIYLD